MYAQLHTSVHLPVDLTSPSDLERSRRAAERYALTEHLRAGRGHRLHGARLQLARWIAPRGLELTARSA
ncbi:hypothetical protein GC722_02395 [Auraticoccus sp. F435]|uniref:Uncharacterized protein n=1 Tax=Auraticoccus cholistanensis TaxID=2656650 RepID=A0A6A9UPS1_9ACTN|nr:hypothetical protein [Auraticoccus cholistanensis]MVA74886.1 hypothetical protein [Auraticoccus cholistanensis]